MATTEKKKPQTILSERQRRLQPMVYEPSTVLTRDLPRDTCLKALQFVISGSTEATFATGTPLADVRSVFDSLVDNIQIVMDGSRTVKSVRPWMMRIQQLFAEKVFPDRRRQVTASGTNVAFPNEEGGFVFGTTGQKTTVYDSLIIYFENILAKPNGGGREATWLMTKNSASAEIRIATRGVNKLQAFGDSTSVTFSNSNFMIDVTTIEQQDVDAKTVFSDWKQTTKSQPISGDLTGFLVELNKGNFLQSIQLFVESGNASGNLPTNDLLTDIKLKINGQQDIKATTFLGLQSENRSRYGLVAPVASGVSQLDGSVLWDFTRDDDIQTSLDCRPPLVDQVHLELNTRSGFAFNVNKPANVTIMTNEIVLPA